MRRGLEDAGDWTDGLGYRPSMPIYEYRCDKCGDQVEVLQALGAEAPGCYGCAIDTGSHVPMKKLVSASSFLLKGAGWAHDSYGLK